MDWNKDLRISISWATKKKKNKEGEEKKCVDNTWNGKNSGFNLGTLAALVSI